MPKISRFSSSDLTKIRSLSSREACREFGVGFRVWQRIVNDPTFVPTRHIDPRRSTELAQSVLETVREAPHLSAGRLAEKLSLRTESVQSILKAAGLNKLHARLEYAGYQVESVRPLQVARQRRVLAARPGSLTHQDFKTFGYLRRPGGRSGHKRIGGYLVVDSLTAYASIFLCDSVGGDNAAAAFAKYCAAAPFPVAGLVLTDNGGDFLSDRYRREVVEKFGCYHRTTKVNHPWSNGKVEALNKTLKYTCFPALGMADEGSWPTVVAAVDAWMHWYNATRAHTGWINQGLPPLAFYAVWQRTPGDDAQKMISLGLIHLDSEWRIRTMGSGTGSAGEQPVGSRAREEGQAEHPAQDLPFAFILEKGDLRRLNGGGLANLDHEALKRSLALSRKRSDANANGVVLAK